MPRSGKPVATSGGPGYCVGQGVEGASMLGCFHGKLYIELAADTC